MTTKQRFRALRRVIRCRMHEQSETDSDPISHHYGIHPDTSRVWCRHLEAIRAAMERLDLSESEVLALYDEVIKLECENEPHGAPPPAWYEVQGLEPPLYAGGVLWNAGGALW